MKKIFTFLLVALTFINLTYAKKVDENTAKIVGRQFMINKAVPGQIKDVVDVSLTYTSYAQNTTNAPSTGPIINYYVFNINSNQGFVIVSGDDIVEPILGYSNQKPFDGDHIPAHVAAWLKGYEDQIQFAIDQQMQATPAIQAKWELYKTTTFPKPLFKSPQGVAPLVQTTWNQSPYYNDLCPYDNQAQDRTVTGCVATAMAQVLKYWNYPATGAGFHSYNDPNYGTQSADFGSTTYDWANMPMVLYSANGPIATLMYHCGVSVDMSYGVAATGGSSAYVVSSQSPVTNCAEYALKTYFGYPATLHGEVRATINNDATWKNMIKTDLDASRPIIYAGFGSGGGHCFVCDGYETNDMFHFNWGWQGQFDGYFDLDALNPEGVGTGGGTGGFNSGQQAIFGIQGSNGGGQQNYTMQLYAPVNISASPIYYGNPFTVHTDILNAGTNTFNGDYCAAIFDTSIAFVGFVDTIVNQQLQAGYHYTNGLTFSNPGSFALLPGTYYIAVFYRPAGGNWFLVADGNGYTNVIQVNVINPNSIEMYAPMTVTPGTTLTNGQQVSVHLDVANYGTTDFHGTWDVSLYDLDGYAVATIQQLTGYTLQAGYHYLNGLTFTNSSLNVDPGTYLMALQYLPDGGNWTLTGSTTYENPIYVTVQQAGLNGDLYEPNNTPAEASVLPVNFSGTTASVTTPGANCSTGNDYDYYKITLDPGFSYTIGARVDDSHHNSGSGSYTLDAIWSDSIAGNQRSQVYDDVDPNGIVLMNGGTVYFQVAPKFSGNTGTYLLVLNIQKNPLGISETSLDAFRVYPNPASNRLFIEPAIQNQWPSKVTVSTIDGREVLNVVPGKQSDKMTLNVDNLQDGVYFLQVFTSEGVMTRQVVIRK